MKKLLITLSLLTLINSATAAETIGEKFDAKLNNTKRSIKHATNRGKEIACDATDKSCLASKVDHKAQETKDYVKDKTKEGKNIIDNDDKKN